MLNIHARGFFTKGVAPLALALNRAGVTPNAITIFGTLGAVVTALICFPTGFFFTGALLIWGFVMLDLVDGVMARAGGLATPFGGVLDSTCDRVADAAVFGGLAWYFAQHGQKGMLLATLLCLVLGSLTSYIRSRAEAAGFTASVGIAERAERLIIVLTGTGLDGLGLPYIQAYAIWGLVAASTITVAQRMTTVYRQAKAPTETVSG
ncbi:CDP-alcohol phosphatidyltransferase family protein [Jatrophihabitans sp.]|uniref:phosphatidylinositol phosphate synthase n=1 Tax=Jatrophihabitans sp. TaxID=1932789 RepID=UPI0030C782C3